MNIGGELTVPLAPCKCGAHPALFGDWVRMSEYAWEPAFVVFCMACGANGPRSHYRDGAANGWNGLQHEKLQNTQEEE